MAQWQSLQGYRSLVKEESFDETLTICLSTKQLQKRAEELKAVFAPARK